jgi:7,8-dihydropterin-6-yl-methyl-4-(beta-D-ribofuranosyl)aminobenzene 5'-phosphate synthase
MNINNNSGNYIAIVYNNIPGDQTYDVEAGAGFSALIMFNEKNILFDTGADATILMGNIKALGLDITPLYAVMISHNHWDHVYGLPGVMAYAEQSPKVFVPNSAACAIRQQNPRAEVISVDKPTEISPQVWSTGPIETKYNGMSLSEQALILDHDEGMYVVTGCAHVGVANIIERAKRLLGEKPILLLTGGFHLANASEREIRNISSRLRQLGVRDIAPSHCTGGSAMDIFKEEWGEHHVRLYLGHVYHF